MDIQVWSSGKGSKLKIKIWELPLKEISLDEITKRLSIDKRKEILKAEPKCNLKFGNGVGGRCA